jgi:hypothetical protein
MQSDKFLGYGKPLIDIEKDTLVIKNVPAPRGAYSFSWLISNSENLKRLRIFELLKQFSRKAGIGPENRERLSEKGKNEKTREVLKKIFEDLKRINEERSSKLVLVYLPTPYDIEDNYYPKEWVRYIEKESRDLGVPLINVLDIFRSLPYGDVVKMFIPEGQIKYPGAAGHLNDQGNEFVARVIYQELRNHPVLSQALSPKTAKKKAGADSNEQFSPAGLGR